MSGTLSLHEVVANIRKRFGDLHTAFHDLNGDADAAFSGSFGALADSPQGGLMLLLFDPDLWQNEKPFERYACIYPIIDSNTTRVQEGSLYAALVAGTRSAPGRKVDSLKSLRAGELGPVREADVSDLNLERAGIPWSGSSSAKIPHDVLVKLVTMGIVTEREDTLHPTVAGMIALGHRPHDFLPGARVELELEGRLLHWQGPLLELVARARREPSTLGPQVREELSEVLLNGFLHRDWREHHQATPLRISVSNGFLEATNPGILNSRWRAGTSRPPNPTLAGLATSLRLTRGRGTGLQRLDERLSQQHLPPLELQGSYGEVQLRLALPRAVERSVGAQVVTPLASASREGKKTTYLPSPSKQVEGHESRVRVVEESRSRLHSSSAIAQSPSVAQQLSTPQATTIIASTSPAACSPPVWQGPATASRVHQQHPRVASTSSPQPAAAARVPDRLPRDQAPSPPIPAPTKTSVADDRTQEVIRLIRARGPLSARELIETLRCTRWAVRTILDRLMADKVVKTSAASARSPRQTYELV